MKNVTDGKIIMVEKTAGQETLTSTNGETMKVKVGGSDSFPTVVLEAYNCKGSII